MSNLETIDPEQANAQMRELQDAEIEKIMHQLDEHQIDRAIIHRVRERLEKLNTVQVIEDDFTIIRTLDQGYEIEWHSGQRAA